MTGEMTVNQLAEEVTALYERWFVEVASDSWDFFEQHLADDWVYINFFGEVRTKADYRIYIAHVPEDRMPTALGNVIARNVGGIGIVHGDYLAPGGADDVDRLLRFTSVWEQREGRWQCLTHHTTVVAEPA